jgi:septation ring formation regulator EzrA
MVGLLAIPNVSFADDTNISIMVTENVSNNAEAYREKPKKWDETYKVDFVNNIDVDSMHNLEIQLENLSIENVVQFDIDTLERKIVYTNTKINDMYQKINGRNNIINNTTILTSQFTETFVISNPSIYDK